MGNRSPNSSTLKELVLTAVHDVLRPTFAWLQLLEATQMSEIFRHPSGPNSVLAPNGPCFKGISLLLPVENHLAPALQREVSPC
jgi:hypothetical protein